MKKTNSASFSSVLVSCLGAAKKWSGAFVGCCGLITGTEEGETDWRKLMERHAHWLVPETDPSVNFPFHSEHAERNTTGMGIRVRVRVDMVQAQGEEEKTSAA
jgi:hypothetical protein